ncbi:MAG: shikimate kinase [Mariprofundales bacterium]|nr:shikimate kinase [Mariprofundales bacterium]
MPPQISLIGPMGAGKSTVGKALAAALQWPFIDLDMEIVAAAGMPIPQIFSQRGECLFRAIEGEQLQRLCSDGDAKVLAAGGGAVLHAPNGARLKQAGLVVWLDAPPEMLAARIGGDANRPLLKDVDPLMKARELALQRNGIYQNLADLHLRSDQHEVDALVQQVIQRQRSYGCE